MRLKIISIPEVGIEKIHIWFSTTEHVSSTLRGVLILELKEISRSKIYDHFKRFSDNSKLQMRQIELKTVNLLEIEFYDSTFENNRNGYCDSTKCETEYLPLNAKWLYDNSTSLRYTTDPLPLIFELSRLGITINTVYRGESKFTWIKDDFEEYGNNRDNVSTVKAPLPRLYRNNYLSQELFFINEYQQQISHPFHDKFSILADMQHYGLPTRLLDVTSNVLVAIFFSLDNEEHDGVIFRYTRKPNNQMTKAEEKLFVDFIFEYSFVDGVYAFSDVLSQLVVNYTKLNDKYPLLWNPQQLQHYSPDVMFPVLEPKGFPYPPEEAHLNKIVEENLDLLREIYLKMRLNEPMLLIPPVFLSERIRNQSGKFLLFTKKLNKDRECLFDLKYDVSYDHSKINKIIIPAEWKSAIKRTLITNFGIDEAFIYPDKEHIAKSILTKFDMKLFDK